MLSLIKKIIVKIIYLKSIVIKKSPIQLIFIPTKIKSSIDRIYNTTDGLIFSFFLKNYFTFNLRPKKSENVITKSRNLQNKKISIILQGPIEIIDNFTYETVLLYLKLFPNTDIILSTWKIDSIKLKSKFKNLLEYNKNFHLIENLPPKKTGFKNINLQILTTKNAIKLAKELKCEFVLKTRTDFRIYKDNLSDFFINLLSTFRTKNNIGNQKFRIISLNLITAKYRLYSIGDILLFGHIDDISKYWDIDYYDKEIKKFNNIENGMIKNTPITGEVFLCTNYLLKIGIKLKWNLSDYWEICRDHFCIIDNDMIDGFWFKYNYMADKQYLKNYSLVNRRCIDFSDWLNLQNNLNVNIYDNQNLERYKKVGNDFKRIIK